MVIAIEGLPGSGKTTTTALVAEALGAAAVTETTGHHPFLQQVYDDADRDDLTVELSFLVVHANPYRRLDRGSLTVCDFSPAKDELFAEDMLKTDDLGLFRDVYSRIYAAYPLPEIAVYLRAAPELCLERVAERMRQDPRRAFEAGLTLDRLRRMQERYDQALSRLGQQTVVVDVNPELDRDAVARKVGERLHGLVPAQASG